MTILPGPDLDMNVVKRFDAFKTKAEVLVSGKLMRATAFCDGNASLHGNSFGLSFGT